MKKSKKRISASRLPKDGVVENLSMARAYRLNPMETRLLNLLVTRSALSPKAIERELGYETPVRLAVYRLRSKLRGKHVKIQSQRYLGYWMEPRDKETVRERVGRRA